MANAIIKPISNEEVAKNQIEGNLPDKPSQATLYGGKVLTPQEIKAWYDRLPKLIVDYYNNLIKAIPGIEEGKISDNSLAAQILTGIREGHSLKNLLEDITSGALADYLKVTEDVNLTSFYEKVLARITTFGTEAPSEEAELGNLYAEIRDYGIRALYMYVEENGVKAWKKLWSGPKIRINDVTHEWEVSYDNGESWQSLDTQAEPRSVYLSSEAGLGLPYSQYKISAVTVPSGMSLKNGDIIIFANSTIAMAYNVGAETYSATVAQSFKGATGAYGYSVHYANVSTELTTTFIADTAFTNNTYNPIKAGDVSVSANGMIFRIGERYSSIGWNVTWVSSIGYSVHYSSYEATSATTEIPQSSISGALNPSIKTNDICITPNGLMFRIGTKKDEFTWNVSYLSSIQGNPFRVTKTFASVAEMEADTSIPEGSFVVISTGNVEDEENARLYVKTLTGYDFITDMSGAKGIKGDKGDRGIQGIPGISIRSCVFPYTGSDEEYLIGGIEAIANYPIKAGDLVIFNGEHLAVIQNVDASKNVFTVGQRVFYIKGDKGDGVPAVTEADDGKFLRVRNGIVVAEDTKYTLNGTYAMKNEINGLESDYYEFQERVTFGIRGRSVIFYAIRVQGMGAPNFDTEIQGCISSTDFTSESNWQQLYSLLGKYWSGGFYNLVFDDVIVSEKLYKLITENGGDAVSRELIDSVGYQVRNIDTTVKNHTISIEKNTSDIAKHSVTLTYHDKRITNLEKGLPSDRFVTDDEIAYGKDVPTNALPYAAVQKIGGMTIKDGETLKSARVTAIEIVGANLFNPNQGFGEIRGDSVRVEDGAFIVTPETNDPYFFMSDKWLGLQKGSYYLYVETNPTANVDLWINASNIKVRNSGFFEITDDSNMHIELEDATIGTAYEVKIAVYKAENNAYAPYTKRALELPEAAQVENGINADCHDYIEWSENGARLKHIKVGVVDMGTLNWGLSSSTVNKTYSAEIADMGLPTVLAERATGILCERYSNAAGDATTMENKTMQRHQAGFIYICDNDYADAASFKAAMQGVMLYYELAKPIVTDISDLLTEDNLLAVEGGGTLTFVNENGLAVPSTIKYQIKEG